MVKITWTLRTDLLKFMSMIFIKETTYVPCELRAEAEETGDDVTSEINCVLCGIRGTVFGIRTSSDVYCTVHQFDN